MFNIKRSFTPTFNQTSMRLIKSNFDNLFPSLTSQITQAIVTGEPCAHYSRFMNSKICRNMTQDELCCLNWNFWNIAEHEIRALLHPPRSHVLRWKVRHQQSRAHLFFSCTKNSTAKSTQCGRQIKIIVSFTFKNPKQKHSRKRFHIRRRSQVSHLIFISMSLLFTESHHGIIRERSEQNHFAEYKS